MLTVGRRVMARAVARFDASPRIGERSLALVLVAVLLSALATEFIGIHAIFGAFLLGAIIPHDSVIAKHVTERLAGHRPRDVPAGVLRLHRPANRDRAGPDRSTTGSLCGVIIAVATAGKFGGTLLASKAVGLDWRDSAALGILMNTRGLVELIVLNIGLDLGVITPTPVHDARHHGARHDDDDVAILSRLLRSRPWIPEAADLGRGLAFPGARTSLVRTLPHERDPTSAARREPYEGATAPTPEVRRTEPTSEASLLLTINMSLRPSC